MKIILNNYGERQYESIEDYAEDKLNGNDYDRGLIEATEETTKNNSRAIGRLLDILTEKKLISENEVLNIIEGYSTGTIKFIKE